MPNMNEQTGTGAAQGAAAVRAGPIGIHERHALLAGPRIDRAQMAELDRLLALERPPVLYQRRPKWGPEGRLEEQAERMRAKYAGRRR
jgi:hypothetical protein